MYTRRQSMASSLIPTQATASSTAGETSSLAGACTRKLGLLKSDITVNLDNHAKQKVYTSGSPVSGHVSITTKRDVRFDNVQIVLIGHTKTRVDGVNTAHEVTHTFLKMAMPIPESSYPVPRILENGLTYTLPFHFIVPSYLTMHACNHRILHDQLQDHHVLLPPSMGGWMKDDMAPEMAKVEYSVKARVFRQPDSGGPKVRVMEGSENIFVLPATAEQPPLVVSSCDKLYTVTKTKKLRKSLLSGKLGCIRAEAIQPPAVRLGADGRAISGTAAQVRLEFEPASLDIVPPEITSVAAKVTAHTFYSSEAITSFPNMGDWSRRFGAERRGEYHTPVSLPSASLGKTRWLQHLSPAVRRDSGYGTDEASSACGDDSGRRGSGNGGKWKSRPCSPISHSTELHIPINLSSMLAKKTPIPTFHSCITSRVYTLQLTLTLSAGSSVSSISLLLPLQVAVEPDSSLAYPMEDLPSFETAVQEAEMDEMMRPRHIRVPDHQYIGTSSLAGGLPGYGASNMPR